MKVLTNDKRVQRDQELNKNYCHRGGSWRHKITKKRSMILWRQFIDVIHEGPVIGPPNYETVSLSDQTALRIQFLIGPFWPLLKDLIRPVYEYSLITRPQCTLYTYKCSPILRQHYIISSFISQLNSLNLWFNHDHTWD